MQRVSLKKGRIYMKNVPELRFKDDDGEDFPEWEEKKLEDVSENIMYGMNAEAVSYDGKNKYIRITDIDNDSRAFKPSPLSSPSTPIDKKYKLNKGDLVIARTGASVGKSYLYKEKDGNLLFAGFLIRFSITKAHPYFVFLQTLRNTYDNWLQVMSMRSGQPGVNAEELKQFKFLLPTLPEQTKIANFLSAIDDKISQLTRKVELLKQYKKGIMQQIFSQQLRFKDDDGEDFPEWEEKKLGDVATLTSSKRVYLSEYTKEGIPFYRGKEISELKQNKLPSDILYIAKESYEQYKYNFGVPQVNDILITAVGTLGNVYRIQNSSEFYFKDGNLIWLKNIKIVSAFLEQLLENNHDVIQKSSIGSTQRALTIVELKKLVFYFPSLPEQTKIANFLTAIDDKINQTQNQLDNTKQYKKGLLQKMFV
jgi:restriction endonuclease S subunit